MSEFHNSYPLQGNEFKNQKRKSLPKSCIMVIVIKITKRLEGYSLWPLYDRKIEAQLDVSLTEWRAEVPLDPKWGVKKNSEGKSEFWFGYKGHLAVGTSSQYILQSLFSSGNLNDGKAAIPLLKRIETLHFDIVTLVYNASKFAVDRINKNLNEQVA